MRLHPSIVPPLFLAAAVASGCAPTSAPRGPSVVDDATDSRPTIVAIADRPIERVDDALLAKPARTGEQALGTEALGYAGDYYGGGYGGGYYPQGYGNGYGSYGSSYGAGGSYTEPPVTTPTRMGLRLEASGDRVPALTRTVQRAWVSLRKCYEQMLERVPTAKGTIAVELTVGKDGKVAKGATASGTPDDTNLSKCFVTTLSTTAFAPDKTEDKIRVVLDLDVPPPPPPAAQPSTPPVAPYYPRPID